MSEGRPWKWVLRIVGALVALGLVAVVVLAFLFLSGTFEKNRSELIGNVQDEALRAGRTAESFPAAPEDHFRDMDGGPALGAEAIKGRNTWMVWSGGNDRFWDYMAGNTFGAFDLLKTLSSHPVQSYGRDNRWSYLGLVNEPGFEKWRPPEGCDWESGQSCGDPDRYGLWLDRRTGAPDPFEDAGKYPGVEIGARGKTMEIGSYYGAASGIVGLRLFPNPDFDAEAEKNWDPLRYYTDPAYFNDKDLVRPYRVGMACAFCHVGPSPVNPPADPEHPLWANLNGNPGAQYFWVDRIFFWNNRPVPYLWETKGGYGGYGGGQAGGSGEQGGSTYGQQTGGYGEQSASGNESAGGYGRKAVPNERNFIFQLFHSNPPGALDTSLVSTDYINNPRTMNAVYALGARLGPAARWGKETLSGGELDNAQFQDFPETNRPPFDRFYKEPDVWTARVLKDGADSVGVLGALNRVYLNIGLFSEEWTEHFRPLVGGMEISPIEIAVAERNSVYWQATVQQNTNVALYFLAAAKPDRLQDAPGGQRYLTQDRETLQRGKVVFAERCARCHSSRVPKAPTGVEDGACAGGGNGPDYLACWNKYWDWTKTDDFKRKMTDMVLAPDFLVDNFLSTDRRIPVTLLQTNACSPAATNGLGGDIWDNFTSSSYKSLPSVGSVEVNHPLTGEARSFEVPGEGRGYTRPASLVSLWSTAPFLQNNSVGRFDPSPSVEARMASFEDSIEKMLWPERRMTDKDVIAKLGLPESSALDVPGYLYRTTAASCLRVPAGSLPSSLRSVLSSRLLQTIAPWIFDGGDIALGPIPKGTPVNLLANLRLIPETEDTWEAVKHRWKLLRLGLKLKKRLKEIGGGCSEAELSDMDKQQDALAVYLRDNLVDELIALSKCPDYVVNKGHYFGTDRFAEEPGLSDADKRALIEFLKYM